MSFDLELPRELDSAASARHAVDQLADRLGEDQLGDVRLLVSELVTNSLRHADLRPEDHIRLCVSVDDVRVRVDVCDPGKGFEGSAEPGDPETAEGWGLYLVETLSDRWGVDDVPSGGHVVWFELDRQPQSGSLAA
jgi:anti-sigma regulatory factor (Ser/Thr protein kinase)